MGGPPANATINRELAAFKRMFNLGRQAAKVVTAPHIPMLKENNVRKGFFTVRDYLRLKTALRCYLKPLVTLAHFTGMRREEMLQLTWDQVDFHEGTIRLDPGTTKNGEPRIVPMSQELHKELSAQRKLRDRRFPFCPASGGWPKSTATSAGATATRSTARYSTLPAGRRPTTPGSPS